MRANVTLESVDLARRIVGDYATSFTAADLGVTKGYLTKSRAFQFETLGDKLNLLAQVGDYGLPLDFPARESAAIDAMSVEQVRGLAAKYLAPDRLTYVVVGDAASQAKRLDALKLGAVIPAKPLIE